MNKTVVIVKTEDENIEWHLKGTPEKLEVWKHEKSSSSSPTGAGEITETITIVKTLATEFQPTT